MTRTEAEWRIFEHMAAIKRIHNEYAPEEPQISMCIVGDYIQFNNSGAYNKECKHPIDYSGRITT